VITLVRRVPDFGVTQAPGSSMERGAGAIFTVVNGPRKVLAAKGSAFKNPSPINPSSVGQFRNRITIMTSDIAKHLPKEWLELCFELDLDDVATETYNEGYVNTLWQASGAPGETYIREEPAGECISGRAPLTANDQKIADLVRASARHDLARVAEIARSIKNRGCEFPNWVRDMLDPIEWYLNRGDAQGLARIGKSVEQVICKPAVQHPRIELQETEAQDSPLDIDVSRLLQSLEWNIKEGYWCNLLSLIKRMPEQSDPTVRALLNSLEWNINRKYYTNVWAVFNRIKQALAKESPAEEGRVEHSPVVFDPRVKTQYEGPQAVKTGHFEVRFFSKERSAIIIPRKIAGLTPEQRRSLVKRLPALIVRDSAKLGVSRLYMRISNQTNWGEKGRKYLFDYSADRSAGFITVYPAFIDSDLALAEFLNIPVKQVNLFARAQLDHEINRHHILGLGYSEADDATLQWLKEKGRGRHRLASIAVLSEENNNGIYPTGNWLERLNLKSILQDIVSIRETEVVDQALPIDLETKFCRIIEKTAQGEPLSVLFIIPQFPKSLLGSGVTFATLSLGLCSIASCLASEGFISKFISAFRAERGGPVNEQMLKNRKVNILDLNIVPEDFDLRDYLRQQDPDMIGVTAMSHFADQAADAAKICANILPEAILINGGIDATSRPVEILEETEFEIAAIGNAEETMVHLALIACGVLPLDLKEVDGIVYRQKKGIIVDKDTEQDRYRRWLKGLEFDDYPYPSKAFDLIMFFDCYKSTEKSGVTHMDMVTTYGCYYNCAHCYSRNLCGPKNVRLHYSEWIIGQMKDLAARGARRIGINDDSFTCNRERMIEVCQSIIAAPDLQGIEFQCEGRGDDFILRGGLTDRHALDLLVQAGFTVIGFGLESGDPRLCDIVLDKRLNHQYLAAVIREAKAAGLFVFCFVMVGIPEQTWSSLLQTFAFLGYADPDWIKTYITLPYRKTRLAARDDIRLLQPLQEGRRNFPTPDSDDRFVTETKAMDCDNIVRAQVLLVRWPIDRARDKRDRQDGQVGGVTNIGTLSNLMRMKVILAITKSACKDDKNTLLEKNIQEADQLIDDLDGDIGLETRNLAKQGDALFNLQHGWKDRIGLPMSYFDSFLAHMPLEDTGGILEYLTTTELAQIFNLVALVSEMAKGDVEAWSVKTDEIALTESIVLGIREILGAAQPFDKGFTTALIKIMDRRKEISADLCRGCAVQALGFSFTLETMDGGSKRLVLRPAQQETVQQPQLAPKYIFSGLLLGIAVGLHLLGSEQLPLIINISLYSLIVGGLFHELGHIIMGWIRHSHKVRGGPYFSLVLFIATLALLFIPAYPFPTYIILIAAANFLVHALADEEILYKDLRNVIFKKPRLTLEDLHPSMRAWIVEQAEFTGTSQIEVIDESDDSRLLKEAVAAKELIALPNGNFYARTDPKDTARAEQCTFVSTNNSQDQGLYNNWQPAEDTEDAEGMRTKVLRKIKGGMQGKTMYVVPYLMGPDGAKEAQVGVQVTDNRRIALDLIRLSKVGRVALRNLGATENYAKGVHVTGDLKNIQPDERCFVVFPEDRETISYGSGYGGNAILSKKFHALRQASFDARKGAWLAEHMLVIGIEDKHTGITKYVAAAFPSASGKTNLAMLSPPKSLRKRYRVWLISDDISWMFIGDNNELRAFNPENGFFGVLPGISNKTNRNFMRAIGWQTRAIYSNVAYNTRSGQVWWEGKTCKSPLDNGCWQDWQGNPWKPGSGVKGAHPNARVSAFAKHVPNLSNHWQDPQGVPISAFLFGGRLSQREPLIRQLPDAVSGIYDAAVTGVETTAAAVGKVGEFREDPMAMRPFFSYPETAYFQHWLDVMKQLGDKAPAFFHVNWFR
ncbi:MAG: phosphoenolpyruvate carboxykinase (GTP), partial [Candidatus Omnitrophica bacterium]|nr:phosphoenolpyruvate carboxykinase (GTP) [Candidatus Omnitrophota bacterium]